MEWQEAREIQLCMRIRYHAQVYADVIHIWGAPPPLPPTCGAPAGQVLVWPSCAGCLHPHRTLAAAQAQKSHTPAAASWLCMACCSAGLKVGLPQPSLTSLPAPACSAQRCTRQVVGNRQQEEEAGMGEGFKQSRGPLV